MELTFLGTASAYPTPTRCVSCIALRFSNKDSVWMFDCGEGSQIQLMKSAVKPGKISKIFISHLHGDHVFGLPGLLCTVSQNNQRSDPVEIYGPLGLRAFVRVTLGLSRADLGFTFIVHELQPVQEQFPPEAWPIDSSAGDAVHPNEEPGSVIQCDDNQIWTCLSNDNVKVEAVWVKHRVPCFAYIIKEAEKPGKLDVEKLKAMNVPQGPLFGRIKAGQTITLADGTQVKPEDVLGKPLRGLVAVMGGDSSDSTQLLKVARNADLLVHEATVENAWHDVCIERGHSTPKMTGELARSLNVRHLILTHFSQRYKPLSYAVKEGDLSVSLLMDEAREAVGPDMHMTCAEDLMTFTLTRDDHH